MQRRKLLVWASGTKVDGGSGFQKLVEATRNNFLEAEIVGVVSNHAEGGVYQRAKTLNVQFIHFPGPWTAEKYREIALDSGADFFALSGWLKLVVGLDLNTKFNSRTVFNIHPGPLPEFGGPGLYGHFVHEAVLKAYREGKLTHSCVCMHFVSDDAKYDRGPVFMRRWVPIKPTDDPVMLSKRVNMTEHHYQAPTTNLVVKGLMTWDGKDPGSLQLPPGYPASMMTSLA